MLKLNKLLYYIYIIILLFNLILLINSQQLSQVTYTTPATIPSSTSLNSVGTDTLYSASGTTVQPYYEKYTFSVSPTQYSAGSSLIISPTAAGCPAPTPCTIDSTAAGQSLQTLDVVIAGTTSGNSGAGSVTVFRDTRTDWTQAQILKAQDAISGDLFGQAVAMDINNAHIALIGAPNSDDLGTSSGSAYIFASSPTAKYWTEGQRLTGSTATTGCLFGSDVQIMGRQAAVSAPGCCRIYLFEQEKPKPVPPPPPKCSDDDTTSSPISLSNLYKSLNYHPYADIEQTKTLQWSQQQILSFDSNWCETGDGLSMSLNGGNLVVGFPYYDNGVNGDSGLFVSYSLETFRGDCTSNIFPTMLSFDEIIEMKENTYKTWEILYADHYLDSKCTHPPKPTPQCEVSRWSETQRLVPNIAACSYFGSNVALCGDLLFVQSSNYDTTADTLNCDPDYPDNPNYLDGAVFVYERQTDGSWAQLQLITGTTNAHTEYGDPLTCDGATMYAGGTVTPTTTPYMTQYSQDSTWDCVVIMLGDQFGDGWGGADLVVSGPGADKQRYTDSCDSVTNPYYIRWCPSDFNECGEVTMEIPGATNFPFYPEIYWGVYLEDSGQWVYGDYDTKLTFNWDCDTHDLSLVQGKSVLTNSSCDCDCLTSRPTLKPTPQEKPKPKPNNDDNKNQQPKSDDDNKLNPTLYPTFTPSFLPSTPISRRLDYSTNSILDSNSNSNGNNNGKLEITEEKILPRRLKSGDDNTHRPTISPAPTLDVQPYTDGHWEWLSMDVSSQSWCSLENRGTKYYIYDKTGTHLLQTGTKCGTALLKCWMVLPPNGDYILRIGGALDQQHASYTSSFCGYPLATPSQFEFSITADQQCIPQEYFTRQNYCTQELKVSALISGVFLINNIHLTNGLSEIDNEIIQKSFDNLFGNSGVTATLQSQDSNDGLLVSFTINVPVTYYGLGNTEFNAPHLTYLKAHDDIISSFKSNLFTSMLDTQIHTYTYLLQSNQLPNSKSSSCHLNSHGSITLLSISESGWENAVDYNEAIQPITFYPDEEINESTFTSSLQNSIPTFLLVVTIGGFIMFLVKQSKKNNKNDKKKNRINDNDNDNDNENDDSENDNDDIKSSIATSYLKKPFKYIYEFAHTKATTNLKKSTEYQRIQASKDDVESNHQSNHSIQDFNNNGKKSNRTESTLSSSNDLVSSSSSTSTSKKSFKKKTRSNDSQLSENESGNSKNKSRLNKKMKKLHKGNNNQYNSSDEDELSDYDVDALADVLQNHR